MQAAGSHTGVHASLKQWQRLQAASLSRQVGMACLLWAEELDETRCSDAGGGRLCSARKALALVHGLQKLTCRLSRLSC